MFARFGGVAGIAPAEGAVENLKKYGVFLPDFFKVGTRGRLPPSNVFDFEFDFEFNK